MSERTARAAALVWPDAANPRQNLRQQLLRWRQGLGTALLEGEATLQLAAGMNVHIFTTGRGTPYGLAEVPVIKVATRNDLANRWHDLMDINAGRYLDGQLHTEFPTP